MMNFDVLIVGGGLAGASLACALRGSALRVALLDRTAPQLATGWDARVYALSPANLAYLREVCGVWDLLPAERITAVRRMDVMGDAGGRLCFDAYESGLDALAWTVESGRLAAELWETARRQSNVTLLCPAQGAQLEYRTDGVRLTLADGRVCSTRLLVGADGADSWVRAASGLKSEVKPYAERGVVANFTTERAHQGTAFQWFREDGVLAYLPLPGNQISIVWSTPDAQAEALLELTPEAFCARVAEAGAQRLGGLELITPPAAFPLRLLRAPQVVSERLALIGDAAHAVHPLSGHGINLGFQDAQVLAEVLRAEPAGVDCGEMRLLRRYARRRAEEVVMVQSATHALHELFRPRTAPLVWARNLGMTLTGRLPLLRATLARYAAGLI